MSAYLTRLVGRLEFTGGRVDREAVERRLGLDVPVWVQYGRWMGGIFLHGTLSESLMGGWPIEERLFNRLPGTMRMTRTMMLEVLRQDYIRTAWAKGLKEQTVVLRHAIKNALIPVVTRSAGLIGRAAAAQPLCGLQLPLVVGGTVIMENLFNLPGLGRLLVDALSDRDYPLVSGVNLFFACIVLLKNLFIDLIYAYLDQRVRYE